MNPDELARYRLAVARIAEAFPHLNRVLTEAVTRSAVGGPHDLNVNRPDPDTDRPATPRRPACPAVHPDLGTRCHRRGEHDRHATIDPDHPSILECVAEW